MTARPSRNRPKEASDSLAVAVVFRRAAEPAPAPADRGRSRRTGPGAPRPRPRPAGRRRIPGTARRRPASWFAASSRANWSSSVDLPAPASPAISTTRQSGREPASPATACSALSSVSRPKRSPGLATAGRCLAGAGRLVGHGGRTVGVSSATGSVAPLGRGGRAGCRRRRGPRATGIASRCVQHVGFDLQQGRTRVQPQFVGQDVPGPPQCGQRVGLPTAGVQAHRQQPPALLAQGVLAGQHLGGEHGIGGRTGPQHGLAPSLAGEDPQPVQPGRLGHRPRLGGELGVGRSPPQVRAPRRAAPASGAGRRSRSPGGQGLRSARRPPRRPAAGSRSRVAR